MKIEIVFKLIVKFLKKKFNVSGLVFNYVEDESEWIDKYIPVLGYRGPVPTYEIENPNDLPWRKHNIEYEINVKLNKLGKMLGNIRTIAASLDQCYAIVEWGSEVDYYIPLRYRRIIKNEIAQNINNKFFRLPYIMSIGDIIFPDGEHVDTEISFECDENITYDFAGDSINCFIDINNVKIRNAYNGEIIELDTNQIDELLYILNYEEDRGFVESIFYQIIRKSGLLDNETFFHDSIDYLSFYLNQSNNN